MCEKYIGGGVNIAGLPQSYCWKEPKRKMIKKKFLAMFDNCSHDWCKQKFLRIIIGPCKRKLWQFFLLLKRFENCYCEVIWKNNNFGCWFAPEPSIFPNFRKIEMQILRQERASATLPLWIMWTRRRRLIFFGRLLLDGRRGHFPKNCVADICWC